LVSDGSIPTGSGGSVHLDVTGLTAGFNGNVAIASTGFLSTDGGTSKTAINFASNQVVINSNDGTTTTVDSSGVKLAGSEILDYAGTTDLFQALKGLRDDLRNYSSMPEATRDASIQARARELHRNFENSLVAVAELGSRSKAAETAAAHLEGLRDELSGSISNLEDADFAEVVVNYNKSQVTLELAQAAGARLLQMNFLAFLR
jgi:flagellin-like hook-associated protein FlgL